MDLLVIHSSLFFHTSSDKILLLTSTVETGRHVFAGQFC